MAEFQLKNIYNPLFFEAFTAHFQSIYAEFDKVKFLEMLFDETWEVRSLKQRVRHITLCLGELLPQNYSSALSILKEVSEGLSGGFEYMFFPDFIEVYGLEDFENSVEALRIFTPLCSSEFAVRPFIVKYPQKMMDLMMVWTQSDNHHVRRLASEGCRPSLPWGMALGEFKKNPTVVLPILEALKNDNSEYVRRSVANNLNDISKNQPELVLEIGERWLSENSSHRKLVKHALRTLLKKGNTRAMRLFGFENPDLVTITDLTIKPEKIKIGTDGFFSFNLKHKAPQATKLRLEYAIYFVKSNGTHSSKVFQLTESVFENNKVYSIERKQHFKNLTTRKHYAGTHLLALLVNGVEQATVNFDLKNDE